MKPLLTVALLSALVLATASATELYRLNAQQTEVGFDIERFGLHWVSVHFHDFQGDFVFDPAGNDSRVDVTVQTRSVDCSDSRWNPQLRSPEWLDVQRYPLMTYRADSVQFEGEDRARAQGELTLHGQTHPVILNVSQLRCSDAPGGDPS